jgi:anaerobic magnesium-protoporphyrin IX monomethyl ester cyclase
VHAYPTSLRALGEEHMKVLLIYPTPPRSRFPVGGFRSYWVPMGLAYIGTSLLRAGCDVRVHVREEHLIKNKFDWARADQLLRDELKSFAPDVVGLSITTPCVPESREMAVWAKQLCGDSTLVVAGGIHPTALPERTLTECPAVDVVVVGEGEKTMVELAAKGPCAEVAGLVWRDGNGGFLRSVPRPLVRDLDTLGMPAYELFDMAFWTSTNRWILRWIPSKATNFHTSRGCTHRCKFCSGHLVSGVGVRHHSVERVGEQIERIAKDFGIEAFRFEDDSIGAEPDYLRGVCGELRKRGLNRLRWDGCLRVDQVEPDLLQDMRSAGCIQLELGFESGSDAALKRLGKGASVAQNRSAVQAMRQAGLRIYANIMVGLPGETLEDVRATEEFVYWARPEVLSFGCFTPLPGTPLFDCIPPEKQKTIDWGDYTYHTSPGLGTNQTAMTDGELEKAYLEFHHLISQPHTLLALKRDTPPKDRKTIRHIRRKFAQK